MYLTNISKNLSCMVGASFSDVLFKIPLSFAPLFQTVFQESYTVQFYCTGAEKDFVLTINEAFCLKSQTNKGYLR